MADKAVQSPLQLFGLYLAWAETALSASVWATSAVEHWTRHFLMAAMGIGLLAYVGIAGFLLIYLVVKRPAFLFNPSDFDKSVQHLLFGPGTPQLEVANPPQVPAGGAQGQDAG